MERLHLAKLPRPGAACHGGCLPARPPALAAVPRGALRVATRPPALRAAASRGGGMDEEPSLADDLFAGPEALIDSVDLDSEEAAILLGDAEDPDEDNLGFSDSYDEEGGADAGRGDEERRSRERRGRVVEDAAGLDELESLDAIALDAARAAPLRGGGGGAAAASAAAAAELDGYDDASGDEAPEYPPLPQRRRRLPDLLRAAGLADAAAAAPDIDIANVITCNSETAGEGPSLYVCVPAEEDPADPELDGHAWADEAAELGAVAVVAQRPLPGCLLPVVQVPDSLRALGAIAEAFYDAPAQRMQTFAVVGSFGKSTTSWLARGILEEAVPLVGLVGDSEYCIGMDKLTPEGELWEPEEEDPSAAVERSAPFRLLPRAGRYDHPPTTPDALHLHKVLAGIADRGGGAALVEVDPAAAADGRAAALRPAVLVFTNVDKAAAAAAFPGDPDGSNKYYELVDEMFSGLTEAQTAIVNLDDPYAPQLARTVEATGAQLLTYGVASKDADVAAEKVKASIWETELLVRTPVGRLEIVIPMVGSYNVANALAALSVGLAAGVLLPDIVAGIEAADFVPGRTEVIDEGQPFPVIVDSARTPEQLGRLIDEVKEAGARRTILVVGCPGGTTAEHRRAIAAVAHFKADVVFFTNDSPGLDPPPQIIADMVTGLPEEVLGRHAGSYYPWLQDVKRTPQWFEPWLLRYQSEVGRYVIEDRFSAIRVAIGMAKARDVVVVAGRGDDDRMVFWDGVPPPRGDAARAAGAAAKAAAPADSPEAQEEARWEAIDEYYARREAAGLPVERGTIVGWFDDAFECRNALARLAANLSKLKDLDRSTLPWTRYPEERESSGLSVSMGASEAAAAGSLDRYLRDVAETLRDQAGGYDDVFGLDSDDEEEEGEEEEDEEGLAGEGQAQGVAGF